MADYNPNSSSLRGMEWRPSTARQFVLDSPGKGLAIRFKSAVAVPTNVDVFMSSIVGSPGLGIEIVQQLVPSPFFPGDPDVAGQTVTVTGWQNQAAGAATFAEVGDNSVATYHRNTAAVPVGVPIYNEMRVNAVWAGVVQRYLNLRAQCQVSSTVTTFTRLCLTIGGTRYFSPYIVVPADPTRTPRWISYDWAYNPSTGQPWLDTEVGQFNGGTSSWGIEIQGPYASQVPAQGFRLYESDLVRTSTTVDDRLAAFYTTALGAGVANGWIEKTLAGGTGAVWAANQWYWLHIFPWRVGDPSNKFQVPILGATGNAIPPAATSAASVTGEHRIVYETVVAPGGYALSAAQTVGEMWPFLLDRAGTIETQSQAYAEAGTVDIYTGANANTGTEITTAAATTYAAIRCILGYQNRGVVPDAALTIQLMHGAGSLTGAGVLDTTMTVNPQDLVTPGALQDVLVKFTAALALTVTTQYFLRFSSTASSGKGWKVSVLNARSDIVRAGVLFGDVEGATQGGQADSYFTGGNEIDRQEVPAVLVAPPTGPATLTVTAVAAA